MATVLMAYQTTDGQTRRIVEYMAEFARGQGHEVRIADVDAGCGGEEAGVDGVLLAASVHIGRHSPAASHWVREHAPLLQRVPGAFVSVSLSVVSSGGGESQAYIDAFVEETGWNPALRRPVAGALRYTAYNFVKRAMMKQIAGRGGLPTDTSQDYEFTDWEEVREIVRELLEICAERVEVARAGVSPASAS
jgi:menaquinone-dependent protoporphyrinogen oxidase